MNEILEATSDTLAFFGYGLSLLVSYFFLVCVLAWFVFGRKS